MSIKCVHFIYSQTNHKKKPSKNGQLCKLRSNLEPLTRWLCMETERSKKLSLNIIVMLSSAWNSPSSSTAHTSLKDAHKATIMEFYNVIYGQNKSRKKFLN